ncbi:MAG: MalY/PatB family protein, partial [Oscillospiraceae bacterium]
MYNFDEIIDRKDTNCVKYGAGRMMFPGLPEDFIPMWIADMDFACPQPVLDAMKARIDKRILGYSMILDPEYNVALANWMKTRHNWDANVATNMFSAGVITVLNTAVATLTKPTDGVILNTPAYHPFDDAIKKHGRKPVYSRLVCKDGYYEMDWQDFEKKAKDPNNTLYFLCNPHNPTGRVWTKEELQKIGDICFSNNVFVISDEIHFDFVRANCKHTVFETLFPNEKRLITCTAPSKTFNLAGNQLSNIFVHDPEIAQKWGATSELGHPNPLSIEGCKAAYTHCGDWVTELNEYLDENFKHLAARLKAEAPKVKFTIPEATYLAWLDTSECGLLKQDLMLRMIKEGLHLEYTGEFVENDSDRIRMNIACPRSVLDKAIDAIVKVLGPDAQPPVHQVTVGEKLPDFKADTAFEKQVSFSKLMGNKKTMLLFLRY